MDAAALRPLAEVEPAAPAELRALFVELNDLKRIHSAGRSGSLATRLFRGAWGGLLAGETPEAVALRVTACALAAARLGDLDAVALCSAGLGAAEVRAVLARSFDEVATGLDPALRSRLRATLDGELRADAGHLPAFIEALACQPRAGVTCPGKPRIILEPPENHAEHCLMVAAYGVLLAPTYDADPATVFLAGLSHHLHNAVMPDSGFTGEELLGEHLASVIAATSAMVLETIPDPLRSEVAEARAILPDAKTPEGKAFHAADVIDRVLQIAQHLAAASLTMDRVLGGMALVHDGPVKGFHDRVLAQMHLP